MKKALIAIALVTVSALGARADVVSAWDVSGHGSPVDATLNATSTSGVSNTPALARTTVTGSAAANSFSSLNWNTTSTFNSGTNYISFDITASQDITLTDLQFAMNGSNTGPRNGMWGYTLDGGSTFTLGNADGTGGNPTLVNAAPSALADWDFTDFMLSSGNTVEFRFWAFGTQGINANGTTASASAGTVRVANISGNDLILNGTIGQSIPEPTTVGLIGLGLAGVVAFARRRKA
jgi:hypothetical protein